MLCGVVLLLYPLLGTLWANLQHTHEARVYQQQINEIDPEDLASHIARAQEWNATQTNGPVLDPWLARVAEDNAEYASYLDILSLTEAMGSIHIPSIKSSLPIYHGTTEEVLNKGIGHLFGSSLPIGGASTHAVLTGHTGLSQATLWDNLVDVKVGDAILIDVHGQKLQYEVYDLEIVLPNETENLQVRPGEDLITLITCTPYAVNSHRLLVHARRVELVEEETFSRTYMPWQWWMTVVIVVLGLLVLLIIGHLVRAVLTRRSSGAPRHSFDHPNPGRREILSFHAASPGGGGRSPQTIERNTDSTNQHASGESRNRSKWP